MRVVAPERRLARGWGHVDRRFVDLIAEQVRGRRILDLGSGYGTVTAALGDAAVGVDVDEATVATARRLHPQAEFRVARGEALPFADGEFETVVLRDALHHLVNEPEWPRARTEIVRVLAPGGRVVVLDPNMNLIVRLSRKLVRHQDEECSVSRARDELAAAGLRLVRESHHTLFTLPLSGGYVGPELLPPWRRLWSVLLGAERLLERLIARLGLARHLSWRYLLVAERD